MNNRMTPIPFPKLMEWILVEKEHVFGIKQIFKPVSHRHLSLFNEKLEIPCGPAAGPHTQLAQNIIAAYLAGARFFELKTVQTLDGEDLPVDKPCIRAEDECYNVEWSTELTVPEALEEYIKAWFALKLMSKEFDLGDPNGFIFNMSVGYDLEGIRSTKINAFIEGLKDASSTPIWHACIEWAKSHLQAFQCIDETYLLGISSHISSSVTLSTLHGCPPDEIERIATYLLKEKGLHTYIKCNPTLLGYDFTRTILNQMGYDYLVFDTHHFEHDLQFDQAVPMLERLIALSNKLSLTFGVKLTNTFPVQITRSELPGKEMYMSGRALFPLTLSLAYKLAHTFKGNLNISFSGGVDAYNIKELFELGIYPITFATTLLKPGGYNRFYQIASLLNTSKEVLHKPIALSRLYTFLQTTYTDTHYTKAIKPLPARKIESSVPLLNCTFAPCQKGCPIEQDIPEYIRLVGEGQYLEALKVITLKNPLPFVTGTICNHTCTTKCRRNFYEEEISIRQVKLEAATQGFDALLETLTPPSIQSPHKVAIIGSGPAGLAAAYFLARSGMDVTVFEKRKALGGIVRFVIPDFRIANQALYKDIRLICQYGVKFELGREITSLDALKSEGFQYILIATGAWQPGHLNLEGDVPLNVIHFLEQFKSDPSVLNLGKNVAIIGGGNTAMDAARAAKRVPGVENVYLVYRRTKRYMPADTEELELALKDGVLFKELLSPQQFKEGMLTCIKMNLGHPDASGRLQPIPTEEKVNLPIDTLISAVGEKVDTDFFKMNGLPIDTKGFIIHDPFTTELLSNTFVIGDARSGPSTVVSAIHDATLAAKTILKRENLIFSSIPTSTHSLRTDEVYSKKGILKTNGSVEDESIRCLECDKICECCVDVCPNRANVTLDVEGKKQILHIDCMCNECGNCTIFCPYNSAPYRDKFTLFHTLEAFNSSTNSGLFVADFTTKAIKLRIDKKISVLHAHELDDRFTLKPFILALFNEYAYLI
ncbi:putative selenate reductase subunit YgfK [Zhenhengia yiwuensis]|uniref:putative selenate reductase subunit YgfK n=1 Tax=Zhenhengia yiwuensis TaxID=2763666 RepID=UPI002A759E5A|nr:putative selenate reductase subunit YgfK [Zhenhengia yiwuensis]MDY3369359.1 putative selenate reductase subunit YgfK [Zhenhengia yiwuensis]